MNRKRETDRINRDNYMMMSKLKNSKPTVCCYDEAKKRGKQFKKLEKRISKQERAKTPTPMRIFPNPNEVQKINPKVGSYLKKHDFWPNREIGDIENDMREMDYSSMGMSSGG